MCASPSTDIDNFHYNIYTQKTSPFNIYQTELHNATGLLNYACTCICKWEECICKKLFLSIAPQNKKNIFMN